MNYTQLLSGDHFFFADDPENECIKMTRTTYRRPMTEDPFPQPMLVRGDPEVIVRHDGFTTFNQLHVGADFIFTERKSLKCKKLSYETYCTDGYQGTYFVFGDPCVNKINT